MFYVEIVAEKSDEISVRSKQLKASPVKSDKTKSKNFFPDGETQIKLFTQGYHDAESEIQ